MAGGIVLVLTGLWVVLQSTKGPLVQKLLNIQGATTKATAPTSTAPASATPTPAAPAPTVPPNVYGGPTTSPTPLQWGRSR